MKPRRNEWVVAVALVAGCGARASAPQRERPAVADPQASLELLDGELDAAALERVLSLSPLPDPPADPTNAHADDPRAALLGQALFFDPRLSKDGETSCATCHDPARSFSDGRTLAEGVTTLRRNTPSLWNVAYQRWFFWDGRADSAWAQALQPLEHPLEQASTRLSIAHVVHADPRLRAAYEATFGPLPDLDDTQRFPAAARPVADDEHEHLAATPALGRAARARDQGSRPPRHHEHDGPAHFYHPHQRAWDAMAEQDRDAVTRVFVNLGKAIAAYERRLVSRRSPFDVFVEGLRENDPQKLAALSAAQRRGLALFVGAARCHLCHSGPLLSDREFHDARVPPLATSADGERAERGRSEGIERLGRDPFNAMGPWSDDRNAGEVRSGFLSSHAHGAAEFKTPSLRNVALSAPYMHQGQYATLDEVIEHYVSLADAPPGVGSAERLLVPLDLDRSAREDLARFLQALTDVDLDPALLAPPHLPPAPR